MQVIVTKLDESFMHIETDDWETRRILEDHFSFYVHNHQHMPKFKSGAWDGKISLLRRDESKLPYGLSFELSALCKTHGIELKLNNIEEFKIDNNLVAASDFLAKQKYKFTPYDSQRESILAVARWNRCILVSATNSGKTFVIYAISKFWNQVLGLKRVAIIVPNIKLLNQTHAAFGSYEELMDKNYIDRVSKFSGNNPLDMDSEIIVATWQSFKKLSDYELSLFDGIITDEGHLAAAASQQRIINCSVNAKHRVTMTGSLNDSKVSVLILKGGYGRVLEIIDARESIERGMSTDVKITILKLHYDPEIVKTINAAGKDKSALISKFDPHTLSTTTTVDAAIAGKLIYSAARQFIMNCEARHRFIAQHVLQRDMTTLVLTVQIEHGQRIKAILEEMDVGKTKRIMFISGRTKTEVFEEYMDYVAKNDDAVVVATYDSLSTGIDNPNIHDIYLADSRKNSTTIKQVIGRGMRLNENKDLVRIWDISDDLPKLSNHIDARKDIYEESRHPYVTEKHVIELL